MQPLYRVIFAALLLIVVGGCSPTATIPNDAKPAYDAYTAFIDDLRACSKDELKAPSHECDKQAIWDRLDAQTKSRFLEAYGALVRIDRIIETYFDDIEHKSMRARTGTDILQTANIKEYKDLFFYLFKPETIVIDPGTESGLVLEKTIVNSPDSVTIQTHANGQLFPMILEDDGVWRTSGFLAAAEAAVEPILASEAAMREYAKANLKTELERRAKVREYFLVQQEIQKLNLRKLQAGADKPAEGDAAPAEAAADTAPAEEEAPAAEVPPAEESAPPAESDADEN